MPLSEALPVFLSCQKAFSCQIFNIFSAYCVKWTYRDCNSYFSWHWLGFC